MSGINLHLSDLFSSDEKKSTEITWIDVANMENTKCAVNTITKKIIHIVTSDQKICNAISTLRSAKAMFKTYGATEALMTVFNSGNMLSDVIGMEIPEITNSNAKAVGRACCESIDETIVDAYEKVKTFFEQIVDSASQYFTKLKVNASCQSATIDKLIGHITNVDKLNARDFSMDELFGYTQPVFMDRVSALQYISDNIGSVGTTSDELRSFEPYLRILGYKVVDKSNESLLEGDEPSGAAPTVTIEPETPEEQKQDAPAPDEVLNPRPVLPEGAKPEEVVSTEEPEEQTSVQPEQGGDTPTPAATPAPVVPTVPPTVESTPDAPQTQPMAVFRWTPSNIVVAATAVKNVLASTPKFASVCATLSTVRGEVERAVESIQSSENLDKTTQEAIINSGRSYASFVGEVIAVYNNSINELVDQVVSMAGKVVSAKSDDGVQASSITEEDPFGINAEYTNEDKPAEQQAPEQPEEKPAEEPQKEAEPEGAQKEKSAEPPAVAPSEKTSNSVETPDGVPNDEPLDDPAKGVDPNGEPEPGKAPHVEPTETPEGEQVHKKTETLLGDVFGTRMW